METGAAKRDDRGLIAALVGDGTSLIKLTGVALIGSGLFAFFLGATGHFLPHDIQYLGVSVEELRTIADARVVKFMIHDRVSFGGAILGVGVLYLWLAAFPLARGERWAWRTLLVSGAVGFASFLTYLSYGYLDTWHGAATLFLLPLFGWGMWRSSQGLTEARRELAAGETTAARWGWRLLLVTSACLMLGGLIIMTVGMTTVFVPQDLEYLDMCVGDIGEINPRLMPLIAHDRAGFGGGVCCCGLTMFLCVYFGDRSKALWQAILTTGVAGFGTAIGVHFPIGYVNAIHLAPAFVGATLFTAGIALSRSKEP